MGIGGVEMRTDVSVDDMYAVLVEAYEHCRGRGDDELKLYKRGNQVGIEGYFYITLYHTGWSVDGVVSGLPAKILKYVKRSTKTHLDDEVSKL